jgi:hypothetical protein
MKLTRKQLTKMMAYHEAGHAVIARVLKININYVTILSAYDTAAAVTLTHSATYHARDADQEPQLCALMMDAVVSLAGPHAEARHRLPKGRRIPDEWDDDRQHAMSFAREAALVKRGVNLREIDLKAIHALSTEERRRSDRLFDTPTKEHEILSPSTGPRSRWWPRCFCPSPYWAKPTWIN